MSKQTNPALIGAFVVGAVVLLAVAVAVFGGSQLFARTGMAVTYFDGSVKGLREGSNVVFKGVRVGFVRNIALLTDADTLAPKIEVTMELLPDTIKVVRDGAPVEGSLESVVGIDELVEAGFSAQLGSESFVTGLLLVELDFRPGRQLKLHGTRTPYPEIPSVPSDIQQVISSFQTMMAKVEQNVDFAAISNRVLSVLQGIDELVNSEALRSSIAGIDRLVNAEETRQIPGSLRDALQELRTAARQAGELIDSIDGDVELLVKNLGPTAERLNDTLDEAQSTLRALGRQINGDTPQMYQLQSTLLELEEAAQSMRALFDYLERHPEALLRGRRP